MDTDGDPRARRPAAYLLRKPHCLVTVVRLARNTGRVGRVLTAGNAAIARWRKHRQH